MKRLLLGLLFLIMASPTAVARQVADPPIVAEARVFMQRYGDDLRAGDRAAVAARYDEPGVWIARSGTVFAVTHAEVADRYSTDWQAPGAFAWGELTYVPIGDEAVSVLGRFEWTPAEGETESITYNGLLVRTPQGLRIRIEDETPIPADAP